MRSPRLIRGADSRTCKNDSPARHFPAPRRGASRRAVAIASNYATVAFTATLGGAAIFVEAGALRDTVTDATTIALWPANFTATPPTAASVGQSLFNYLAAYPRGC